jgi:hypothetical protein
MQTIDAIWQRLKVTEIKTINWITAFTNFADNVAAAVTDLDSTAKRVM